MTPADCLEHGLRRDQGRSDCTRDERGRLSPKSTEYLLDATHPFVPVSPISSCVPPGSTAHPRSSDCATGIVELPSASVGQIRNGKEKGFSVDGDQIVAYSIPGYQRPDVRIRYAMSRHVWKWCKVGVICPCMGCSSDDRDGEPNDEAEALVSAAVDLDRPATERLHGWVLSGAAVGRQRLRTHLRNQPGGHARRLKSSKGRGVCGQHWRVFYSPCLVKRTVGATGGRLRPRIIAVEFRPCCVPESMRPQNQSRTGDPHFGKNASISFDPNSRFMKELEVICPTASTSLFRPMDERAGRTTP